ncbi:uroporphyrinogen decarboxylase family protein [Desulfosporosinus sp. BICA1-9]|uniref:uroporphyrinogen decarboxylase family protein n=1 Tax=Desulfosporosinus sp. BICA1-9 TaxID=1531958 RepID=UPI000A4810A5|nr:uroporphyrinogen decarboxylase family protein [Desulfosporosinus sp. BICA1-9]HBW35604.1 methylcobamide--CoM methyltransferase [Desulfosporosinus sp.]
MTSEAETFGSEVKFVDTEAPTVTKDLVSDRESVETLRIPSLNEGRAKVFLKGAELAAQYYTDRPTFGGMLGPFSLAAVLMGLEKTLKSVKKDPELVHILLEKYIQYSIKYAQAYKDIGANEVLLPEPSAGLLPPDWCDEFSSQYVKRLVDTVQDEGFFIVLHNCGYVTKLVNSMVSTGAKGYHFGNVVKMLKIIPQIPGDYLVFGNIDPSRVLNEGTPESVKHATLTLLEEMKPYPNFVLSSGCDIPPGTPIANLEAFFDTLSEFNKVSMTP